MKRHGLAGLAAVCLLAFVSWTGASADGIPVDAERFSGRWTSNTYGVSGDIAASVVSRTEDGFAGKIEFLGSDCARRSDFEGRFDDAGERLRIAAELGGSCRTLEASLKWDGAAWKGGYTNGYGDGDTGTIVLRPE